MKNATLLASSVPCQSPTRYDDVTSDALRVGHQLLEGHGHRNCRWIDISERSLIGAVGEEARLLELDGEEERSRYVVAFPLPAIRVSAATLNLVDPEGETRGVRIAAQEVVGNAASRRTVKRPRRFRSGTC